MKIVHANVVADRDKVLYVVLFTKNTSVRLVIPKVVFVVTDTGA